MQWRNSLAQSGRWSIVDRAPLRLAKSCVCVVFAGPGSKGHHVVVSSTIVSLCLNYARLHRSGGEPSPR